MGSFLGFCSTSCWKAPLVDAVEARGWLEKTVHAKREEGRCLVRYGGRGLVGGWEGSSVPIREGVAVLGGLSPRAAPEGG